MTTRTRRRGVSRQAPSPLPERRYGWRLTLLFLAWGAASLLFLLRHALPPDISELERVHGRVSVAESTCFVTGGGRKCRLELSVEGFPQSLWTEGSEGGTGDLKGALRPGTVVDVWIRHPYPILDYGYSGEIWQLRLGDVLLIPYWQRVVATEPRRRVGIVLTAVPLVLAAATLVRPAIGVLRRRRGTQEDPLD